MIISAFLPWLIINIFYLIVHIVICTLLPIDLNCSRQCSVDRDHCMKGNLSVIVLPCTPRNSCSRTGLVTLRFRFPFIVSKF